MRKIKRMLTNVKKQTLTNDRDGGSNMESLRELHIRELDI